MSDVNYDELDPGIRRVVRWLNEDLSIDTSDSGDGKKVGMECALDVPNVHAFFDDMGDAGDAAGRLFSNMLAIGRTPQPGDIQLTYDPADGAFILSLYHWDDARMFGGTK